MVAKSDGWPSSNMRSQRRVLAGRGSATWLEQAPDALPVAALGLAKRLGDRGAVLGIAAPALRTSATAERRRRAPGGRRATQHSCAMPPAPACRSAAGHGECAR